MVLLTYTLTLPTLARNYLYTRGQELNFGNYRKLPHLHIKAFLVYTCTHLSNRIHPSKHASTRVRRMCGSLRRCVTIGSSRAGSNGECPSPISNPFCHQYIAQ
jgi:hypothetical protein